MRSRRNVLLLYSTRFMVFLVYGGLAWYLPYLINERAEPLALGVIQSISSIPSILMFAGGILADAVGARLYLAAIPLVVAASLAPLYFVQSFTALAAAYFMLQLVHLDPPATLSLLTRSVEKENLGKYLSLSRTILYTAIAAAPLAFSTIVENFGVSVAVMVAVATLLSASFLRLFLKEIKDQARSPSGHGLKDLVGKLKAGLSYIKTG